MRIYQLRELSKEELLQIVEGKSKEATREEGDTVIAVGGSLKKQQRHYWLSWEYVSLSPFYLPI